MKKGIDISIILLVYNHAPYIQKALDSILMQKTTAQYEILVHDDASTDGTQEILKQYVKKYPYIKLYLRKKKGPSVNKIAYELVRKACGKYIAQLEGDDYWIGENKLEIQFQFLKSHPQYAAVYMDSITINETGRIINDRAHYITYDWRGEYNITDYWYSGKYPGQAGTMMAKNIYKECDSTIVYKAHDVMGDITDIMLLAMNAPIYRINEIGSARRVVRRKGKDNWNSIALERDVILERITARRALLNYYEKNTGNYVLVKQRWKTEFDSIKSHLINSTSFRELWKRGRMFIKVLQGMLNNQLHIVIRW